MPNPLARYQALMDAAIDGIVLIDQQGQILDINSAALTQFGYARDELMGRNVACLMPEPDRSRHDSYLQRYLQDGQPRVIGIGREVQGQRKDGSRFPLELAVGEIADKRIGGFVGFLKDLSDRKRMEAELAAHEQELRQQRERLGEVGRSGMLAELATGIAHEINQPLAAIHNYAQACRRLSNQACDNRELIDETLEKIATQAGRAAQVVQSMRRLVQHQTPARERIPLNELLMQISGLMDTAELALQLRLDDGAGDVDGDPIQLQQVIINLVRNAQQAHAAADINAPILLASHGRGDSWVEIRVCDQGPGIDHAVQDKMFEPFVTSKPDGLGLGLAISRSIVDAHGGELRYERLADGGSCFALVLPRCEDLP